MSTTSDGTGETGDLERTRDGWTAKPDDAEVSFPQWVGPYRLIELLGRGGMGSVFLAEQTEPIKRHVALKLTHATAHSKRTMRRFEAERQALAMMNHPNIAQVYDAGSTDRGEPYFVMEYVVGVPITHHCDHNRLMVRERIELMIAVCEGVQHAHQKGIIHRDLKPSNVLVSRNGRAIPKIIDFGIAKAVDEPLTDQTLLTREGGVVGTPAYMSPERIKPDGDIDTRADVYSLGVLLYELLTGELPFGAAGGVYEVAERVLTGELVRPSTKVTTIDGERLQRVAERRGTEGGALAKRLRGDLDWLTMKAMARERERRYGSAAELAADLRRHLNREPVEARPPSLGYRMGSFIRRHWMGVAAGALVALSLVAGIVGTSLQARRANLEAERASREAEAARQVSNFLVELFEVSDPSEARGETVTAREILDRGAAEIERELADQPLTQARLQHTMGMVFYSLGLLDSAEELLSASHETRQLLLEAPHPELADSQSWMGTVMVERGDLETAEDYYSRALAMEEQTETPDPSRLALHLTRQATLHKLQGRYGEAEAVLERARIVLDDTDESVRLVNVLVTLGHLKSLTEKHDEAEAFHREALRILESEFDPDHPEVGAALTDLGVSLTALGRYDEAAEAYERSLRILEAVYEPGHPHITNTRLNLANFYHSVGRTEDAVKLYEQALEAQVEMSGPDHHSNGALVFNLSSLYDGLDRPVEAEHYAEWALRIFNASLPPEHHFVGLAEQQVASLLQSTERTAEAAPHAERALTILTAAVGPDHHHTAVALNVLAKISVDQARTGRAEELFLRAGEVLAAIEGPDTRQDTADNLRDHAALLRDLGRDDEAAELEARASAIEAQQQPS